MCRLVGVRCEHIKQIVLSATRAILLLCCSLAVSLATRTCAESEKVVCALSLAGSSWLVLPLSICVKVKSLCSSRGSSAVLSCSSAGIRGHCGEISCVNHFKETKVLVHFELFFGGVGLRLRSACSVFIKAIESVAVEVDVLNGIQVLLLLLFKLIFVHSCFEGIGRFVHSFGLRAACRLSFLAGVRNHNS